MSGSILMDDGMSRLEAEILTLVAEHSGAKPERVGLDTDLFGDLGLTGRRAALLIETLRQRYGVDFTGFAFHRHFTGESDLPPYEGSMWTFWLWTLAGVALLLPFSLVLQSLIEVLLGWRAARDWWLVWLLLTVPPLAVGWLRLGGRILPGPRAWRAERIPVRPRDLVRAVEDRRWSLCIEVRPED